MIGRNIINHLVFFLKLVLESQELRANRYDQLDGDIDVRGACVAPAGLGRPREGAGRPGTRSRRRPRRQSRGLASYSWKRRYSPRNARAASLLLIKHQKIKKTFFPVFSIYMLWSRHQPGYIHSDVMYSVSLLAVRELRNAPALSL